MSISSATSSAAWLTARPIPTAGATVAKNMRNLSGVPPATKSMPAQPLDSDRAQHLIDSMVQVDAGRRDSVEGYTKKLAGEQKALQTLTSLVNRLPAGTSQKERDAWNAQLTAARNEINYSQSQIAHYQSQLDGDDPTRETTLDVAAKMLGVSTEDVHKMYTERAQAYEAAQKAAQAAAEAADSAANAAAKAKSGGATEWGWDASGLRSEIKVNGVVVGRVYNSGTVEMADEYGSLGLELGFGTPLEGDLEGPDLAEWRIGKLKEAFKNAQVEIVMASTAQTQAEYMANKQSARLPNHTPVDRSV